MIDEKRLIQEFCELARIDSLSFQEQDMAEILSRKLIALNMEVNQDSHGNIYARLPGTAKGTPLLFSAHMDTVAPGIGKKAIVRSDGKITSAGDTILGADDLSGIAAILEALRTIQEDDLSHREIEILFPVAEEVYLKGSSQFDFSRIKAKEAYTLDLSGSIGTAATKAPTLISFQAVVHGKASHAGFAPERGVNAIQIASRGIAKIRQGQIDDETTLNIGTIKGGTATNIVSDTCTIEGEIRSFDHNKANNQAAIIKQAFKDECTALGGSLTFSPTAHFTAYDVSEEHPVVTRFQNTCDRLNIPVQLISTLGGSDNNNFLLNGITGIVLACGMHNVHSCEEYTTISDLVNSTQIVLNLMTSEV